MKKIVHNLRKKSEEDRRHILNLSVFILAFLLIVVWGYSFGANLVNSDYKEIKDDFEPLKELSGDLSDEYNDFVNSN